MKYIAYWELDQHNMDAAVDKVNQIMKTIDQSPEKFAKVLYPHTLLEIGYSGFTIIDAQDHAALGAMLVMASPEVKINFIPIYDAMEALDKYQQARSMMPGRPARPTPTRPTQPETRTEQETFNERFERELNV